MTFRPCPVPQETNDVTQPAPRRRKSADPSVSRTVKTTVVLDANTHARLAAAASMDGMDRSAWAARCIADALKGVVVIDRRKSNDHVDPSGEKDRASAA